MIVSFCGHIVEFIDSLVLNSFFRIRIREKVDTGCKKLHDISILIAHAASLVLKSTKPLVISVRKWPIH